MADFLVEAGDFWENAEDLMSRGLGLAASPGPAGGHLTLDPFPLGYARDLVSGPADLAVYAYAWTLQRLARRQTIFAVDWARGEAGAVDLRGYRVAALVRCANLP